MVLHVAYAVIGPGRQNERDAGVVTSLVVNAVII